MYHRIAIVGATSRIGPAIIEELASTSFEITIIVRPSSTTPPSYPNVKHLILPSDTPTLEEWTKALQGFDALVCAMGISSAQVQRVLADACAAAVVKRYILADYGSVSSDDAYAKNLLEMYKEKSAVRGYADAIAAKNSAFTWSSLITGHFFDYGLQTELLGFNLDHNEVTLFDGGHIRWSSSTLKQIGRAVVGILRHGEETANRLLYIQSFCYSQREIAAEVERARGRKLRRITQDSAEWISQRKQKAKEGDPQAVEELVEVLGILRSNWEDGRKGFANQLLQLKDENLEQVVKEVVGQHSGIWFTCSIL